LELSGTETRRITHQLGKLERRLIHHPDPAITVALERHAAQRNVQANLRLQLAPLGGHLVSHQSAPTIDRAVRLGVADLERQHAQQRGHSTYGVPSRRLPAQLRPHPTTTSTSGETGVDANTP
jgi:ribosome-associated translation inhibitor RaiA